MKKATPRAHIFKKAQASSWLPPITAEDHKATRGRSVLFAGSRQFPGAGVLAARGALRTGSGYVTLAPSERGLISSLENPDFLVSPWDEPALLEMADSVLLGPGFGLTPATSQMLRTLLNLNFATVVVDADALTVAAQESLFPFPASWISTPHVGELSRCLGWSTAEITKDRRAAVLAAQEKMGGVVLLKGSGTLVTDGKRLYKNASGNSALAKSGTGDVLAGIITALRAQKLGAFEAAILGAYIHGATANLWVARRRDPLSMTASDVLDLLPRILYVLRLKS